MERRNNNELLFKQYLLGALDPESQERLEEQFLTADEQFDELLAAEDELIDQYLGDELSAQERTQFEQHFLAAPERQHKLDFGRVMHKYIAQHTTPWWQHWLPSFLRAHGPLASFAFAVLLLLVVGGSTWVVVKNLLPPSQSGQENPGRIMSVVLTPGLIREGGELKRISVPADVATVQLQLAPEATTEYQSYHAVVQTAEGREVFAADGQPGFVASVGKVVNINIPAARLTAGDYQLRLSGRTPDGTSEDAGRYSFRVLPK
jgi:hypothetical protein